MRKVQEEQLTGLSKAIDISTYRTCEQDHRELETKADEAVDEHHLEVVLEIMD